MFFIERIDGQEIPPELREPWNQLSGGIPFRRWEWLANWWKYYGKPHELYVLVARDERGTIRGIAPWFQRRSMTGGRVVEPLGSGKVSTDYLSLLCSEGDAPHVADAFAEWLNAANGSNSQGRRDAWDLLHLPAVVEGDPAITELAGRLSARGCRAHHREGMRTWRVTLPDNWEAYVSMLSKPGRRQARKATRRLSEPNAFDFHEASDLESLQKGFEILIDLHQRRWESVGIEGCFTDERFTSFLKAASEELFAARMVQLNWVSYQGKPIVINFELYSDGVEYVYQGGMDPDARMLCPGWIQMAILHQRAIARGRKYRDYLRGDEPYKKHWRGGPTQLIDWRIVPSHTAARLRHGVWMLGDSLKHWIKQRLRGGTATASSASDGEMLAGEAEPQENNECRPGNS